MCEFYNPKMDSIQHLLYWSSADPKNSFGRVIRLTVSSAFTLRAGNVLKYYNEEVHPISVEFFSSKND